MVVAEYNFDAWGRRRSADDWSYTLDGNDLALFADRGFTGHETLSWFNLVNMNGRLYDPLVGRFLSVDPYVQMPDFTQNVNRYSYCINNPLRFTDKSGEFFIWDDFIIGFVKGLVNGDNPFKSGYRQAENCVKIYGGLFAGNLGQILSRFTWELPQTIIGLGASLGANELTMVQSVSYYDGATIVRHNSDNWGAFTIGSYINGDNSIRADPNNDLFQHEYGHYLQSQEAGWAYFPKYAIPSLIDAKRTPKGYEGYMQHMAFGVEQDANLRGRAYFKEAKWNYKSNPIFGSGQNPLGFDRDYSQYRTNQGLIHTKWWEYGLSFIPISGWTLIRVC